MLPLVLPSEIWYHIASLVDPEVFKSNPILSVNKDFLEVALNRRYKAVDLRSSDPRIRFLLERLRDPYIAERVRTLDVFLDGIIKSMGNASVIDGQTPSEVAANLTHLTNVTSFTLYASISDRSRMLTSTFWATFGSRLEKLRLHIEFSKISEILPPPGSLPNLRALTLLMATDKPGMVVIEKGLVNTVATCINEHSRTLETLNITLGTSLDYSRLFLELGEFPKLASFSLDIGRFECTLLSDPSSLTRFLLRHSLTLKHLRLLLTHLRFQDSHAPDKFTSWMHENVAHEDLFSGLETFIIKPRRSFNPHNIDIVTPYTPRFRHTLVHLILFDRMLSFREIESLVNQFSHRPPHSGLKTLELEVTSLNPQLFDLLSAKLPGLDDLGMNFLRLTTDVATESVINQETFSQVVPKFVTAMQTHSYPDWKLRSLWVQQSSGMTEFARTRRAVFGAIETSVPSLREGVDQRVVEKQFSVFN